MGKTYLSMTIVALTCMALLLAVTGCPPKQDGDGTGKAQTPDKSSPQVVPVTPAQAGAFEAFKSKAMVPVARVPLVAAPKIDGTMDAAYGKATPLKFSFLAGGDTKPTAPTTVWAVTSKTHLCLFVKCESEDMDALLAEVRERDGSVWQDDCIELFIDPTNQRQIDGYMHIAINALGTTAESKGPKGDADFSWNPTIVAKPKIGKKDWTLEVAIPLKDLTPDVKKINRVWAMNFNRMAYLLSGNEDTAWSPTGGTDSHVPSKFGALWMDVGNVDNTK